MSTISTTGVSLHTGDLVRRLSDGNLYKVTKIDEVSITLFCTTGNSACFIPLKYFKESEWRKLES